jgi:hypothetical protein
LPGELIVSLTSYPARYSILELTVRSLLTQTIKPDRVVLWLAPDHVSALPNAVADLQQFGLEIRQCEDIRSFKKLIPSIGEFPDAYIVTADDDLYYPPDWLETLVNGVATETIVCWRAVRPQLAEDGALASYNDWEWDVDDEMARGPSLDLMLESGAGALFPPRSLHPMVVDKTLFLELCPDGDDLWYNVCARKAGSHCKKVGGNLWLTSWRGSQESSLWKSNSAGGNDRMIKALQTRFGNGIFRASAGSVHRPTCGQEPVQAP